MDWKFLHGNGQEEFIKVRFDVLTDMLYRGDSIHAKELYEFMMKVYNKEIDIESEEARTFLSEEIFSKGPSNRNYSRLETFITGEYTICGNNGDIVKVLNKDKYDEQGDIEKDYNFIILMNEHEKAKKNIISGAYILFDALSKSETGAEQIDTIKWLLFELTNDSRYAVEDINWDRLLQGSNNYTKVIGSSVKAYIKAWENFELWQYESGAEKVVPSTYMKREDGVEYYKVVNGKISYNIPVTDKENGELIEQSEGEALFQEKVEICTMQVENYINEKGLDLTRRQINVLIAITYQYGLNYLDNNNFAEKYIENPEGISNSFSAFKQDGGRNTANYLAFSEGIFTDKEGNIINIGPLNILDAAQNIHSQMKGYDYCVCSDGCDHAGGHSCGLPPTFEQAQNSGLRNSCCATFVAWALIEAGYEDIISQVRNRNYVPTFYPDLEATGAFTKITSFAELEPGDLVFMSNPKSGIEYSHVQIYAGEADGNNSYYYNAGSRAAMQVDINIQSNSYVSSRFVCALRMDY